MPVPLVSEAGGQSKGYGHADPMKAGRRSTGSPAQKNSRHIKKIPILSPLKHFATILLMGILFFNWYGYQLLSNYWQDRADRRLEASFDKNNFDESQLISLKIPLTSLSYYNSSNGFERVDGQIEIGGVRYKYVKRRIFQDSLELLCIPNLTAMQLQTAKNDFFRQVNDLQQQNQGKKNNSHSTRDNIKDYCPAAAGTMVPDVRLASAPSTTFYISSPLPSRYTPIAENPPELL
jgi:hypothetical protein